MPKITRTKIMTLILIGVIGFLIFSIIKTIPEAVVSYENLKVLRANVTEKERQKELAEVIKPYLNTDEFLEQQAKIKLNYKRPDEKVIIFKTTDDNQSPFNDAVSSTSETPSMLARVYNIVLDLLLGQ